VWEGPDELRPLLRPVEELVTHPDNPRRGDIQTIATSLREFGQLKPVIAKERDGRLTIFAGNHTYRAAREELGWTHVAVSEPAYLGDDEAEAYLLMDNRAADLATYDYGELTAILGEREQAGTLGRTGFDADELAQLRDEAAKLSGAALSEFEQGRDEEPPEPPEDGREAPAPPLRQILLTFRPPEAFDGFARKLQTLRREYGTEDVSSTVAEAIDRAYRKATGK
jgi:ParB-like chromosome segregation protein Spo0J